MAAKLAEREAARLRGVWAVLWMVLTGGGRAEMRSSSPSLSSSSQLSPASWRIGRFEVAFVLAVDLEAVAGDDNDHTAHPKPATVLNAAWQHFQPGCTPSNSPSNSLLLPAISPPRSRPPEPSVLLACRAVAGAAELAGSAAKRTLSPAGLADGCRRAAAAAAMVGSAGGAALAGQGWGAGDRCTAGAARGAGTAAHPPDAPPLVAVSLMAGRAGLPLARSLAGLGGSWARSAAMASLAAATAGGGAAGLTPEAAAAGRLLAEHRRRVGGLEPPAVTAAAAAGGQPNVAAAGTAPAARLPPAATPLMPSPPSSSRAAASMAAWLRAVSRSTPSFKCTWVGLG